MWGMEKLGLSAAERDARLAHLHFSTLPLTGLSDVGANFIPYLMGQWPASKKIVSWQGKRCHAPSLQIQHAR